MKTVARFFCASFLALATIAAAGTNETFKFDASRSTIAFKVRHMLGTAAGKFTDFSGTIDFDAEHPEHSSVAAVIQAKSIDTGIGRRDEHLRSSEFFNVARFPEIRFKSATLKQTGVASGEVTGELTMHGITRPVRLIVEFLGKTKNAEGLPVSRWVATTNALKRADYGLVWSPGVERISMIGQDVNVRIEIEAIQAR